jgi:RNA polymerase sigma factor (sigma-70 family)
MMTITKAVDAQPGASRSGSRRSVAASSLSVRRFPVGRSSTRTNGATRSDGLASSADAAFEQIYESHHKGLLGFCRHMLGSQQEAEDAVQQTFLSAVCKLRAEGGAVELKPWLYCVAHNNCIDILRRRSQCVSAEFEISTEGLSEEVERRQELRDLLVDVRGLPEAQRAALLLSSLDTTSHAEIAEILDCPRDKVKSLIHQAHTALAQRREAREISCAEVRSRLTVLRGGALRRAVLVRHLESCPGCRAFRTQMRDERRRAPAPSKQTAHASVSVAGGMTGSPHSP